MNATEIPDFLHLGLQLPPDCNEAFYLSAHSLAATLHDAIFDAVCESPVPTPSELKFIAKHLLTALHRAMRASAPSLLHPELAKESGWILGRVKHDAVRAEVAQWLEESLRAGGLREWDEAGRCIKIPVDHALAMAGGAK